MDIDKIRDELSKITNSVDTIYLELDAPTTPTLEYVRPTQRLNFRQTPDTTKPPIRVLEPSEILTIINKDNDPWYYLKDIGGVTGYAHSSYLTPYQETASFELGHALVGLHGPADPEDWAWDQTNYNIIEQSKVEAVKLLSPHHTYRIVQELNKNPFIKFLMARLFVKFDHSYNPAQFVDEVLPNTRELNQYGVNYFEIHNEPNLYHEGYNTSWGSGESFSKWFIDVKNMLSKELPDAKFGFPGVSPGPDFANVRVDSSTFLKDCTEAINYADFMCMHTYWGINRTYQDSIQDIAQTCSSYPDKVVFVTEFSNGDPSISDVTRGNEYVSFYRATKNLPTNLGATFSFCLSSTGGFQEQVWRGTQIPAIVGAR